MDWFLYGNGLRLERVNILFLLVAFKYFYTIIYMYGVFCLNTLTANYEYSRSNRENLPLPIQIKLSKKP